MESLYGEGLSCLFVSAQEHFSKLSLTEDTFQSIIPHRFVKFLHCSIFNYFLNDKSKLIGYILIINMLEVELIRRNYDDFMFCI